MLDLGLKNNLKVAIRKGHNEVVRGASGLIDEVDENTKILDEAIKILKEIKNVTVINCSAPISQNSINKDLVYGVNKANAEKADIFVSIHFNNAYKTYDAALGCEVLTYGEPSKQAIEIQKKLVSLGFKNRGNKQRPGLYELRATNMSSIIVEVCFVESKEDVALYKKLGPKKIAKAIVEGILLKDIPETKEEVKPTETKPTTEEKKVEYVSGTIVKELQKELNTQFKAGLTVDGIFNEKTISKLVIVKKGAKGNLTKIIQKRLTSKKYKLGTAGADGIFGECTEKAVKEFQKANKLVVDGIVGTKTWTALFEK